MMPPGGRVLTKAEERNLVAFWAARSDDYWKAKSLVYYRRVLGHMGPSSWMRHPMLLRYPSRIYVGDHCMIRDGARLEVVRRPGSDPGMIVLGDNVTIEQGVHIAAGTLVELSDEVALGSHCVIVDTHHPVSGSLNRAREIVCQESPVRIERRVFLGTHVIVLPGVTIGANTIVGAGSVVTRDLPADVIAAGSPARVLRSII